MWEWGIFSSLNFNFNFNFNFNINHSYKKNHCHQNLLPIQIPDDEDENDGVPSHHHLQPLASFKMILTSLFSRCNTSFRYLFLALFSPLLLPLICAAFPFLCGLELFFRLCRRKWRRRRRRAAEGCGGDGRIEGGEGENGERLLQRYLEDQLILVAGSLYDCGDDDDEEEEEIVVVDVEYFDSKGPLCN